MNKAFIIQYRFWIFLFTGIVVAASAILLIGISFNSDLETYLPDSIEAKKNSDTISGYFGSDDRVVMVFETDDVLKTSTLVRIRNMSHAFGRMKEFRSVMSLFDLKNIKGEQGQTIVEPVIREIPVSEKERDALRGEIRSNDLVFKLIVSEDFRHTLIILTAQNGADDKTLMSLVDQTIAKFPGDESLSLNGQPFMRNEASHNIARDMIVLLPIGLIIMFLVLLLSFREIRAVILPFSVVVFSTIVALALIPLFGWELSIIGILLPIMMIAIANNYGIYFIAKYQEMNASIPGISMEKIATESYSYLRKPVIFCGLTTIAGVLGLATHILKPARQMGIVSGIAIGFALLISLLYIPAVMSLMRKGKPYTKRVGGNGNLFEKLLKALGNVTTRRPKRIIGYFAAFLFLMSAGLIWLETAADHNSILPEGHSYNRSLKIMNNSFGGSKIMNILFEGDIKDPELLNNLDRYEKEIKTIPGVGRVTSIATILRKMSTALNNPGDEDYNQIPKTRDAVAQYFELYSMSGDPGDFESLVDFDYTRALLTIQYQAGTLKEINAILTPVARYVGSDPRVVCMGGYSLIEKEICESVVSGQNYSLIFAFIAILVLLSIIFRSWVSGLLGVIPLVFAVLCTFGLMGWTGIKLNIVTALLSSVSIGLGVDFTIQMFWKIKSEIHSGLSMASAIIKALTTIGRGITINAFSVMLGFSVLFLSAFPIIRSFALLIIVSLLFCLSSSLLLIPALCLLLRPAFLMKIALRPVESRNRIVIKTPLVQTAK
jgi:uncharacterized protein